MKNKKAVLVILAAILIGVISIFILKNKEYIFLTQYIDKIKEYINSYGNFAIFMYIGIFILRTLFMFFPYSIMVLIGGGIFGAFKGFIYSMISIYVSASIAFFIARFANRGFVQKFFQSKIKEMDLKLEKHGFKIILTMRASCMFPFDILSYAAGLTRIRYRNFILGSVLGMLPETFSLTLLGEQIDNPFSNYFLLAVGLVFLTIGIPYILKKARNQKEVVFKSQSGSNKAS